MLTSRMMLILKELMSAKSPITSNDLANRIQVTSRTIRNDIKELNEIILQNGGCIKSTRGIGYELEIQSSKTFKLFLQEIFQNSAVSTSKSPNSHEERVNYIVRKLLLVNSYIKLEEIADELYISKSTLKNDLVEVRKRLKSFKLEIESKPYYGIKVKGKEMNLRFCLSEYLFNRKEIWVDMQNQLDFICSKEEINKIKTIILEEAKTNEIEMSDITLNNLSIHFAIACKRIKDKNYVLLAPKDFEGIYNQREYDVAKQIVTKIEIALNVSFPETEIAYIAIHLLGTNKIANTNLNKQEFESFVNNTLKDIINEILIKIDNRLNLRLQDDEELFIALGFHLKPAINRLRYGMNVRNPMLDEMKTKYPLAFDAAILASKVLRERLGIEMDEDEIGYIALHISVAMYRQKMNQCVKRCIIVCASGMGSAMLLKYKLQSIYFNRIVVVDTIDYYRLNETSLQNIDFILTTIPIEIGLSVPIIYVNTILGTEDIGKIEDYLQNRTENKIDYVKEDLIFLQKDLQTKEEVIKFLVNEIKAAGYVDGSFGDSVLERERLSPTSFGNLVAIPHPMTPLTSETLWALCTLKRPIDWGGNRVQFVCLLSLGENKTPDLQRMYEYLIEIVENEQKVKQLICCKEKEGFIEVLNATY
ncbi:BglG family transcription antiterminator [Oceanobacillus sp. J11TS1]|uniref:BglG family transcription antiterminator n=1 Tax=Oceanobacillus sp. J11TS1 TaxID=2807191 RepID=UPI001B18B575|nr:BglG family transcription antiterminator [Oceanobacillus sp. J11TS1]GIO24116.1 putative licABCH operon regulator [Oceanobacillus sp. J11TS1]